MYRNKYHRELVVILTQVSHWHNTYAWQSNCLQKI